MSRPFGPYPIKFDQIFYETDLSFAFVNLKPLVPGHVLICPKEVRKRFRDLTQDEIVDLWATAQFVGRELEQYYSASALNLAIQDGEPAGQTVPHVHVHIVPRQNPKDQKQIEQEQQQKDEKQLQSIFSKQMPRNTTQQHLMEEIQCAIKAQQKGFDIDRKARGPKEMADEAQLYRNYLKDKSSSRL